MHLNENDQQDKGGDCEKLDLDLQLTRASADYPVEFLPCSFWIADLDESLVSLTSFFVFLYLRCISRP